MQHSHVRMLRMSEAAPGAKISKEIVGRLVMVIVVTDDGSSLVQNTFGIVYGCIEILELPCTEFVILLV